MIGPILALLFLAPRAGEVVVAPYQFRTYDGVQHAAELGHLWVSENRASASARLIQIGFIRLKSTSAAPGNPIVFLAGGPGVPGTVIGAVPVYYALFEKLRTLADVILVDQRGLGQSLPHTSCPAGAPPPDDVFTSAAHFRAAALAHARRCAEHWRAQGLDLTGYTTAQSAGDLDDLRAALHAQKLSVIGHSYGTGWALAALRRYPDRIDRAVLAAADGPDRNVHMPFDYEFGLRQLSPEAYDDFHRALAGLEREPLSITLKNGRKLMIGPFFLQFTVKSMMADGRRAVHLPASIAAVAHRDASALAPLAQDLYDALTSGFTAMQFAVQCSDGWSKARYQLATEQAARSVFGAAPFVHLDPDQCAAIGAARPEGDAMLPLWSSIPVLLLSGTLDSNAPPFASEELLWGLPNGIHIMVKNGFHETLPAPEVQAIVVDFLAGRDVRGRTVKFDPPAFTP